MAAPVAAAPAELKRYYWQRDDANGLKMSPSQAIAANPGGLAGVAAGEFTYRNLDTWCFALACHIPNPGLPLLSALQRLHALRDHLVQMFPSKTNKPCLQMMALGEQATADMNSVFWLGAGATRMIVGFVIVSKSAPLTRENVAHAP